MQKSKSSKSNTTSEILINIFNEFGVTLANNVEEFNQLNIDAHLFQIKLKNFLKQNDSSITVEKFQQLLESYLDTELNFIISLLPTKVNVNAIVSSSSSHSMNQDSLIKLLAELNELQEFLFDYLLTKLLLYCDDDSKNEKQILNLTVNISTYILNQFRYQPKILNSEKLCEKFIDLISLINSTKMKKELINCIPDVINDCKHDKIAASLEQLLGESELISCTLETLKYFKFNNENAILLKIIDKLFLNYNLINTIDLPMLINFMLKAIISLNSQEILNKLRKQIQFDDKDLTDNVKYLIFDVLKEYFQVSSQLITLYIDVFQTSNRILSIDLLILFIIYTMPQNAKLVDKVIKDLVRVNVGINESLVKRMFQSSGVQIINELFDTICQFNKNLILNPNPRLSQLAACIYKLCYEQLDRKYKQIVINFIVNHAISSITVERDNALDILYDIALAEQETKAKATTKLSQFAIIIKILLDFIDYFSIQQTRKLYFIMCTLAYDDNSIIKQSISNAAGGSIIQDTLYIMITKQLSSNQTRYKQMGVMGVLMMLKSISNKLTTSSASSTVLNSEIKNILQLIYDTSKNSPETMCLFYDYLNSLIRSNSLIKAIEDLLKDNLKDFIKNLFRVTDVQTQQLQQQTQTNQILVKNFKLKVDLVFGLDEYTSGALNLHKQIINEIYNKNYQFLSNNQKQQQQHQYLSPVIIPSLFRLISSLERKSLNDLKSYLGIPVYCISELSELVGGTTSKANVNYEASVDTFVNVYNDIEKKCFLDTLFHLINWFTELINAFTLCSNFMNSEEINEKILVRLNLIIRLKELLLLFLPQMPFYKPPVVIYGLDDSNEVPFIHALLKKSKGSGDGAKKSTGKSIITKKRKAKSAAVDGDGDDDHGENNNESETQKRKQKKAKNDEKEVISSDSSDDSVLNNSISIADTKLTRLTSKNIENETEFFSKLSLCFREFDINLLNMLNLNLELSTADLSSISDSVVNNIYIKPKQFVFILNDLNAKLEFLLLKSNDKCIEDINESTVNGDTSLSAAATNTTSTGLSSFLQQKSSTKLHLFKELNSIKSTDLIDSLIMNNNLINNLFVHLSQIFDYLSKDSTNKGAIVEANSKEAVLNKALNQLLKLILTLFKWFENNATNGTSAKSLFNDFLFKLNKLCFNDTSTMSDTSSTINTQPTVDVSESPLALFKYFAKLSKIVNDLSTAQHLCELLDALFYKQFPFKTTEDLNKTHEQVAGLCIEFLKRSYTESDAMSNKKMNNDAAFKILKIFERNCPADKAFNFCKVSVGIVTSERFSESRENHGIFPTLKQAFGSYYKYLLEYIIKWVKLLPAISQADAARESLPKLFEDLKLIIKLYTDLVNLSKHRSFKEINLMNVFKNTKAFFEMFIKHAMSWFDQVFETHKDDCIENIKVLQTCMLYLQDMSYKKPHLSKQIPQLMKLIESFQLRVKQMLYVNRCDNAFVASLHLGKLTLNDATNAKTKKKTAAAGKKQVSKANVSTKKGAKKKQQEEEEDEEEDKENNDDSDDDEDEEEEEEEEEEEGSDEGDE